VIGIGTEIGTEIGTTKPDKVMVTRALDSAGRYPVRPIRRKQTPALGGRRSVRR